MNKASQLAQSVYFVTTKGSQQEKSLSHKCSALVFKIVVAAMVYQEPHFWTRLRTEGQELCAFLFLTQK